MATRLPHRPSQAPDDEPFQIPPARGTLGILPGEPCIGTTAWPRYRPSTDEPARRSPRDLRGFPTRCAEIAHRDFYPGDLSIDHPYFTHLRDSKVRSKGCAPASAIRLFVDADPAPLFPFSGDYDARTVAAVDALGYAAANWTVDSLGWEATSSGITPASIRVPGSGALRAHEIVLMHVGSNPHDHSDPQALADLVAAFRDAGCSFVILAELAGWTCWCSSPDYSVASSQSLRRRWRPR